jgi:hypothetical protein
MMNAAAVSKGKGPTSLGQLLGKPRREKLLADWAMTTGVGFLGREMLDGKQTERREMMCGEVNHFFGNKGIRNKVG